MKREASNLKEPPTIKVFLKDGPPKPSYAEVTQRTDAGSIKSGTKSMNSSKSGTSGTVFLGSGAGSLDFGTSHLSSSKSKFLKAGSSHNKTPDPHFPGSEPSKVTVASGARTSYTGSIKYNFFSACSLST